MANRKRGPLVLPDELKTDEKHSTKKELAQRRVRPCPPVPIKVFRRTLLSSNGVCDKPKPIYFNKTVELSPNYNPNLETSYFEQLYPKHALIGEGSFGKVYRARGTYDNRQYAIKKLKSIVSVHDRYAEIKNNEKIGFHPNCVQFYMAWEEGCELFMLLEACQMSLSDYANKNNNIPEELLWDVLYDMCQALKYLHSKHFLHLDVKPGNIMMKNGHYKLADFGVLVDLNLSPMSCTSTLSDGDGKYLALEVLNGTYTPYCDIFGLGLTLLELAADLELPSDGPLWQQLRHEILPDVFYKKVTLGFKVIIEKMLKPEYEKRPSAEKILKFETLRLIEKRDKKKPRINYAAEYLNQEIDNNDNNNVIQTPRCPYENNTEDFNTRLTPNETYRITLSPKILFQDNKKSRCLTAEEYFASPKGSHNLNSTYDKDNSTLAVTLQDSLNSDSQPMETDEIKLNDESDDFSYLLDDEENIMTSTPVVRNKLNRRVLTFE
ncbi:unnamed protein product [Phyllotreta striolata]|uniref:non-specific serine/threonine protein kinase n=1 Tax=Phyllotreta striolata TaxID=444603 RepID=A0A9N9XKT4_PHYSR|nr:unnamed protein product [Phyllotreta striolata]